MTPGEFLNALWALWPGKEGSVLVWTAPGAESTHVPVPEISAWSPSDDEELIKYAAGKNVYTSPGLRRSGLPSHGRGSQGGQADIVGLCGFVLDLDMRGGKHAAENLPETDDDVARILEVGPDPSLVVSTGGGLHCWWLFSEPWVLLDPQDRRAARSAYKGFIGRYIKRGEELGFHVDQTATIQHLFRLPGTKNCKGSVPVEVEVIYADGPRHARDVLVPLVGGSSSPRLSVAAEPMPLRPGEADPLEQVREWMRRVHPNHRNKRIVEAVLAGESLAPRGERDDAMQRAVSTIAWLSPARGLPAETLAELLRPSLAVWAAEPEAEKTLDDEMDKALEKLDRAVAECAEKAQEEAKRLAPLRRFLKIESQGTGGHAADPADEEMIPNEALEQYAIVQYKNSFWAQSLGLQRNYVIKTGYRGPFTRDELLTQLASLWEGGPSQFDLLYVNEKGEEKAKTLVKVVQEHAVGAHDVIGHFELQESYFDPASRKFHEAICPVRDLVPEFDSQVDEWLRLLGGERILDWIAAVTQLRYQCCALYLAGPSSCGKSVLATGLSQLWHEAGPTQLGPLMQSSFNAEMFRCPLINLDEGLPDRSFKNASAFLRSLVADTSHTYNQKGIATRKVVGSIRLLISANNDNVLKFGDEEMSALDLEAFVGRFLHIRVSDEPVKWIEERNAGRQMTEGWVAGGKIARHALWLRDNRVLNPGKRFLVEGETTAMHKALVTQGPRNGLVLEWLARYLTNPVKVEQHYKSRGSFPRVYVGNQKILVNTQGVLDAWELYLSKNSQPLTTNAVGRSLNQLSSEYKPKLGVNGERAHFHQVDPELVFSWAEENQVGDLDAMHENLSRPLTIDDAETEDD